MRTIPEMEILNSYIIASVQRSGTHLLCTLLRSTGVAGLPAEHFLAKPGETWERRWKSPSRMQYIQRVLQDNTTANGVFGTVVMWSYFDRMLEMLRDIPKYNAPDRADLLASVFHRPKYVWLRRRNRVEQAVSWAIACQTGVWAQKAGKKPRPRGVPKFDLKVIDEWCNRIAEHNTAWSNYFRENRIEPLTLFYEDLVASNQAAVERVLEFLHVPLPARIEIAPSGLEKQADEMSAQWIAAYLDRKNDSASKRDRIIRRLKQSLKRKEGPKLP
jgi:trehalose 2-sulfotransferase